jgi:hypothetical protein
MGIHPALFLVGTLFLFWLACVLGSWLRVRHERAISAENNTFRTVEGAVLTLTGLLLGFTFSMAVNRYEHRRDLEIREADAISTLWQRSAALAEPTRSEEQRLIREYVPVRVEFLASGGSMNRLQVSLDQTNVLQGRMWAVASDYARSHTDSITSLFLTAMGDSFSHSEERTAAFENRIPLAAWIILMLVATAAIVLVSVDIGSRFSLLRFVLPVVVAAVLALMLDLDSPRYGWIAVQQNSMLRVAQRVAAGLPQGNLPLPP